MNGANLSARLSRNLVKTSKTDTSLAFLLATLLLGTGWIAFTSWGVWIADVSSDRALFPLIADIAYACLTFLSPADVFIHAGELPWQFEVGRNCALGLTLLGLVKLLQRLSGPFLARTLMRNFSSGHSVIVSSDGAADAIAIATSDQGIPTALADPTLAKDDERLEFLERAGVVVVRGNSLPHMVEKGARLSGTSNLVVWNTADAASLGTALELRSKTAANIPEIAVRIASPLVQQSLRAAPHLLAGTDDNPTKLRPVSQIGSSCRVALGGPTIVRHAAESAQERVTALLIGEGEGLQWVADLLLRQSWSYGLGGPQIEICGSLDRWQGWLRARRALLSHADAVFDADLTPKVRTHADLDDPLASFGRSATWAFVDLGEDQRSLIYAFELATRAHFEGYPLRVCPLLHRQDALADFINAADLPLQPPIVYEEAASLPMLLERQLDEQAARIHLSYMKGDASSAVGAIDWDDLNETMLHANRSAANHLAIKEADIAQLGAGAQDAIEELGRIEHARWSADKLLDGWQFGERDDARLRHPNLVPWSELDEETREKDLVEYRAILARNAAA